MSLAKVVQDRRPAPELEPGALRGPRMRPGESVFKWLLMACLAVGVVFLAVLLAYIVSEALPRLDSRLFTNFPDTIDPAASGGQSAILGTLWVISFTALFCLPTGIMAAIYLEEYADTNRWYNRLIELNIQNLAAVPSIVYGILGLGILARQMKLGNTVLTGALTLSLLVLPVVIIASREAIRAVPPTIRQGSLALGATQWQTIRRQVLPAAVPGIATGSILALSRAIGEAAPLVMLGIAVYVPFNPEGAQSQFTALPMQIFFWIRESREEYHYLAAAAIVVLLAILLLMNAAAIWLRNRYSKRW
ncbi:phosphate ABC transporter permease PstA [Streptomyces polyrhachis]|uniref:Phosphate transport system permease protein PstA n=1 Tax=Streptomyces polyrhachis TaxID=1282885 RepID=A0ABW2GBP6_9ACTN